MSLQVQLSYPHLRQPSSLTQTLRCPSVFLSLTQAILNMLAVASPPAWSEKFTLLAETL